MFSIMIDLEKVEADTSIDIICSASTLESLFVEWLNALLAQIDLAGLFFSRFEVLIKQAEGTCTLTGKAYGEPIDQEKHQTKTEVKAATYSGMKYEVLEGKHTVQCVVDV